MTISSKMLLIGLLAVCPAGIVPVSASIAMEFAQSSQILSQIPGDYDVVYRRYRGDDEVDNDNGGRGRGLGRSGSSDGGGSNSGGGGTSDNDDKPKSGGGSAGGKTPSGSQSDDGKADKKLDDSDRF